MSGEGGRVCTYVHCVSGESGRVKEREGRLVEDEWGRWEGVYVCAL